MSRFKWKRRREAVEKAAEMAIKEGLFPYEAAMTFLMGASSWYCDYPDEMSDRQVMKFVADVRRRVKEKRGG